MKTIQVHELCTGLDHDPNFKVCSVNFDKESVLDEPVYRKLFNVIWLKEGKCTYSIDFETYNVEGSSIFFLTPGQVFQVESEAVVKGTRLAFSQDFYCIDRHSNETSCHGLLFNRAVGEPFIKPLQEEAQQLESTIFNMFREFENPGVAHEEMLGTYLRLFLINCTRIKEKSVHSCLLNDPEQSLVNKFNQLLEKNYRSNHNVNDYADMLGESPKSLGKKIKNHTGSTVSSLIQQRLIIEAKRMLYYSDLNVKEIAYKLGFIDPSYFNKFFKKLSGTTPAEFKNSF